MIVQAPERDETLAFVDTAAGAEAFPLHRSKITREEITMRTWTATTVAPIGSMLVAWSAAFCPVAAVAQETRDGQIAAMGRIVADVREARDIARTVPDVRTRERLELLLSRAELTVRDLQQAAIGQQNPPQAQPAIAMPPSDFARFLTALSANAFDDARLATVKTLGRSWVTAEQGRQILKKFSFDKGREEAAVFIYSRLVDPHMFSVVLEAMAFEKSRSDVMARIKP